MHRNVCPRAARSAVSSHPLSVPELLEPRRLMSAATAVTQEAYLGGVQLRVTGTEGNDQIAVRFDPALGLVVTNAADGSFYAYGGPVKTVRVDGGAGNDSITVDGTAMFRSFLYGGAGDDALAGGRADDYLSGGEGTNTLDGGAGDDVLVAVGGGVADRLTGGEGADSFWLDNKRGEVVTDLAPTEVLGGALHRVGSFFSRTAQTRAAAGNVSLAAGNLPDPAVTEADFVYSNFSDRPLFGDAGPIPDDVVQGAIGDCFYLAVLSSTASLNPGRLRESVADLGDGTYAVQFRRGSARWYVRVDADLPVYDGTADSAGGPGAGGVPAYAALGAQESLWVAVMEKAYAVVRAPAGGYGSLDGGWMREAYSLLGSKSRSVWTNNTDALMRLIKLLVDGRKSVTFGTGQPAAGSPLLSGHAYVVVGVNVNAAGVVTSVRMRNPWGVDGDASLDGNDDGYVTVTPQQAIDALAGVCAAAV